MGAVQIHSITARTPLPAPHQPPHGGAVFESAGGWLKKSAIQVAKISAEFGKYSYMT
jgi:hypothetical protein